MSSCQSGKNPRDDTVWALLPPPLSLKKILATLLAYVQSKYTNGNAHAQFQFDLHSFDKKILSFENSFF